MTKAVLKGTRFKTVPLKNRRFQDPSYHHYAHGTEDELITASPAYLGLSDIPQERRRIYLEYVSQNRIQEEMLEKGLLQT